MSCSNVWLSLQERVWDYVKEHGLPYNELLNVGFSSIGDSVSTEKAAPSEGERAGGPSPPVFPRLSQQYFHQNLLCSRALGKFQSPTSLLVKWAILVKWATCCARIF